MSTAATGADSFVISRSTTNDVSSSNQSRIITDTHPPPLYRTLPPLSTTQSSSLHYQRLRRQRQPTETVIPRYDVAYLSVCLYIYIRFYYPHGKPISSNENEAALQRVQTLFSQMKGPNAGQITILQMADVCKKASLPIYWKRPVFDACVGVASGGDAGSRIGNNTRSITFHDFAKWWNE